MEIWDLADPGDYHEEIGQIVYSNPYKRLAHKSQIIIKPTGDHFRSRLTHTEEVNQIALTLGRKLRLNLDLISSIARAHDLGHTPYGHAGEIALQNIVERELGARFDLRCKPAENPSSFRREIFHHSSNSARIVMKDDDFGPEGLPPIIVSGILTHSWGPWKDNSVYKVPDTYEAQVVAIADQLAGINHDTEDILEGKKYTEYDLDRFNQELTSGLEKEYPTCYSGLRDQVQSLIVSKGSERGYGRQKRVEKFLDQIVQGTQTMVNRDRPQRNQASKYPISLSKDWSEVLRYYERFLRELIEERVPWFVMRDHVAAALISTAYNHIWSRARECPSISTMQTKLTHYDDPRYRRRASEESRHLDHFKIFFEDHYSDDMRPGPYESYLARIDKRKVDVWDTNIMKRLDIGLLEPSDQKRRRVTRLVAVVDFVAGMTDRYCLDLFNEVYQEFVLT